MTRRSAFTFYTTPFACASLCREGQRRAVRGRDNQEEPEVDSRALVRDCKELYLTLQA